MTQAEKTTTFDLVDAIKQLPHLPGVYRFYDAKNKLLYVGKARDLFNRVSTYFSNKVASQRIAFMVTQIARFEVSVTRSEVEALLLESNLIKTQKPRYNIVFRDDKSYPYLKISQEDFPQITFYRGSIDKKDQYFGPYPSAQAVKETIHILQRVFQLRTCENTQFNHRTRACLLHQIGRCSGPCIEAIDKDAYKQRVFQAEQFLTGNSVELLSQLEDKMMQYASEELFEEAAKVRDQIASLSKVLEQQSMTSQVEKNVDILAVAVEENMVCLKLAMVRGGRHLGDKSFFLENVVDVPEHVILETFMSQHYLENDVPRVVIASNVIEDETLIYALSQKAKHKINFVYSPQGDGRIWLDLAQKNAQLSLNQRLLSKQNQLSKLQLFAQTLSLDETHLLDIKIEAFDISHTSGEATQASCVVYHQAQMQPTQYRHFNIQGIKEGDDYAAMREVLTRRYKKLIEQDAVLPDIVLIDGGKGQVSVAKEVFEQLGIPISKIVGVVKGEKRKVGLERLIYADHRKEQSLGEHSPVLMFIDHIRDEAHRFAITRMRAKRDGARRLSQLESIPGVGPKRRQKLLARFGSIRGVANASIEDLSKIDGISLQLAQQIYQTLH